MFKNAKVIDQFLSMDRINIIHKYKFLNNHSDSPKINLLAFSKNLYFWNIYLKNNRQNLQNSITNELVISTRYPKLY